MFKWLLLKVQNVQAQLKGDCLFVNFLRAFFLNNYFWYLPYHFLSFFIKVSYCFTNVVCSTVLKRHSICDGIFSLIFIFLLIINKIYIYIYIYIYYIYIYILYIYCLNLTPGVTKRFIWPFLLYLYNGFFLEVLYEKRCSTKGAAHSITANVVTTLLSPSSVHPSINKINKNFITVNRREAF